jgi:hypothetical protein
MVVSLAFAQEWEWKMFEEVLNLKQKKTEFEWKDNLVVWRRAKVGLSLWMKSKTAEQTWKQNKHKRQTNRQSDRQTDI